jgi:YcxB-like protein
MDPTTDIELEYTLSTRELFAANFYIHIRRVRYLLYAMAICAVLWAIGMSPNFLPERLGDGVYGIASRLHLYALLDWFYPLLTGGGLTVLVLVPSVAFFRARSISKKFHSENSRCIFSANGLNVQSAVGTADLKWKIFNQVRETRRFFFLYSAPTLTNIVPKRAFATQTEIASLRSLFLTHVKKASLRKD